MKENNSYLFFALFWSKSHPHQNLATLEQGIFHKLLKSSKKRKRRKRGKNGEKKKKARKQTTQYLSIVHLFTLVYCHMLKVRTWAWQDVSHQVVNLMTGKAPAEVAVIYIIHSATASVSIWSQSPNMTFPLSFFNALTANSCLLKEVQDISDLSALGNCSK